MQTQETNPIVIAVDFDDVVFHLNKPFAQWHNVRHGTNITYNDITNFDLTLVYNIELSTIIERLDVFRTQHWQNMTIVPGALETLVYLKKFASLHNITARCESLRPVTEEMLRTHMPNIFTKLHLTNGITSLNHNKKLSKVDICNEIGAFVLIDDNPYQINDFTNSNVTLLVPDRPWNQAQLPEGVIRCGSWKNPGTDWQDILKWINRNT